jgi:ATP-dependent DNA helicase RecQ
MRGQRMVEVARPRAPLRQARPADAQLAQMDGPARDLFERLRLVRRELAEEAQVPAFMIFADSSLRAMATRRPVTPPQFASISGVGERKVAAFGDAFLSAIRAYCDEQGLESWPEGGDIPDDVATARRERRRRERPERAERADSPGLSGMDSTKLPSARQTLEMFRSGLSLDEIGEQRNLARTTLVGHLCDAMNAGEELDLERLIPSERLRLILETFARLGVTPLSPVKEALGDAVSYDDLRVARAALHSQQVEG